MDHTVDISPGNFAVDWCMGYLNYQTLHHLFPTMPQYRGRAVYKELKEKAKWVQGGCRKEGGGGCFPDGRAGPPRVCSCWEGGVLGGESETSGGGSMTQRHTHTHAHTSEA